VRPGGDSLENYCCNFMGDSSRIVTRCLRGGRVKTKSSAFTQSRFSINEILRSWGGFPAVPTNRL